jgi:hypothetical protein
MGGYLAANGDMVVRKGRDTRQTGERFRGKSQVRQNRWCPVMDVNKGVWRIGWEYVMVVELRFEWKNFMRGEPSHMVESR